MVFSGLRVLEVGSLAAASWCARHFADFGADVLKLEQNGGDPLRKAAPRFGNGEDAQSAWFAFLNFGKRIAPDADADFAALARDADVIVLGDCLRDLSAARRDAIIVDASWFGRSGPYRNFVATDATVRALAGLAQLVGPAEGPPMAGPDFQAAYVAGLWAFIGACAGLMARQRDGGRTIEASVHEACVTLTEYQTAEAAFKGAPQDRLGVGRFAPTYPLGVYKAKDGWIGVTMVTPAQWRGFCDMLGLHELGADPDMTTGLERLPHAAKLEELFLPRLAQRTAAEWFAEGLKRKLPIVVVPKIEDLASTPEFHARGAIAVLRESGRALQAPASPLRLVKTPPATDARLAVASLPDWKPREAAPSFASPAAPKGALPLQGLRILDFTMGWAGPLCARIMADLGADVVKIEGCSYPDWWRGVDRRPHVVREKLYEKTGRFAVMNRNKRGVTLDLTRPEGVKIARTLAATADAVIDNYSVDVLPKLGLAPETFRAADPKLVTLSMSAFGASSPWRDCRAYGSTLEQASGLPRLLGRDDDPPVMGHPAYGDPVGGLAGAAALLAALLHARRTGQGQHVDLSQVECMMQMSGPWILAHTADGQEPVRSTFAPPGRRISGIYPCEAPDTWLAVDVADQAWPRLRDAIGQSGLPLGDTTREALAAWTRTRDADAAMNALQAAGVAAAVVRRPLDLTDDPHLVARGFWSWVDREHTPRHAQPAPAVREAMPYPVRWPAPTLGQHNEAALREIAGLTDAELARLESDGVIGRELLVEQPAAERRRA
ncbi:MAG: CoA transferase [Beijerinckiaceae bacterium]